MKLYHGTYIYFDKIDLNSSMDKRDFGMGFYTTTNFEQAKQWALKIGRRNKTKGIILHYGIDSFEKLKLVRWEYAD